MREVKTKKLNGAKKEYRSAKPGKRLTLTSRILKVFRNKNGMEMVQVAILIALAVALGIIFRTEITQFVNNTFRTLNS